MLPEILTERRGHLGLITLNRPKALNALNTQMCQIFLDALLGWRDDPDISQVAVQGSGERGLCAGGDIVAIYQDIKERTGSSENFWRIEYQLNVLINEYPKPYIALMDGIVLGGGIGISAHGSHRIVTNASKCGMPEVGIGFFPDVGGTHLLGKAPRAAGRLAALTGTKFGAADAILLGLADSYVPQEKLPSLLAALETEAAQSAIGRYAERPPQGFMHEPWVQAFDEDNLRAVLLSLQNSDAPRAHEMAEALRAACPSSVRLTSELMRQAGNDLRTDLKREFRAALHRLDDPDFAEGIRAAVIDKDRTPHWAESLPGMSHEQRTERHLGPLPGAELNYALLGASRGEKSAS
ncbi:3-hydroxyisobutyryl-CoA hydrolase [Glutamicibacter halophytocola]|uniref:3-hydroxyisobutyryl-CoA hydrolase n=1 Tax=Glutamicibacter halophytocola TaxID=1933880 RepID=A0AA94XSX2_9MICC|nr:3-hydroxyisobutyryl-CoA hydrolase [Glutamicibacter halophytocola]UUX59265.1 3-hydroxyisobutyryl-CoA hydrolase [Glutamicibacter halophytocola]